MKTILIIVVLLVIALAIFAFISRKQKDGGISKNVDELEDKKTGLPAFYGRPALTEIEQALYHRLVEALPNHAVLAQVQVSQIVGIKKGPLWQTWFNNISRKSVDFLICLKDFTVVAAIELDDSTHEREDRKKADTDKDAALFGAGYQVIRWSAKSLPSVEVIRSAFHG